MVTHKPTRPKPAERKFWREAFLGAELPVLMMRKLRHISPDAAARIAAEYADAALAEYRRRFR